MRRGYQLAQWHRRAETVHRKAVELAHAIAASEGESELTVYAHDVHCSAHQLCSQLEGEQEQRASRLPATQPVKTESEG